MKNLLFILLIATTGMYACKKSEQAMGAEKILPSNSENDNIKSNAEILGYDMVISFISIGAGIDTKLKDKIDNFLISFNKENNTDVTPVKKGWGREGEIDYNFTLKNLSTSQKKKFISSIEELAGGSDMVHITFNK